VGTFPPRGNRCSATHLASEQVHDVFAVLDVFERVDDELDRHRSRKRWRESDRESTR